MERFTARRAPAGRNPDMAYEKALEYAASGDFEGAINALHELTRSRPDHMQAWNAKATLYRLVGNKKMADLCSETARGLYGQK